MVIGWWEVEQGVYDMTRCCVRVYDGSFLVQLAGREARGEPRLARDRLAHHSITFTFSQVTKKDAVF
jgi:hypothetical protein